MKKKKLIYIVILIILVFTGVTFWRANNKSDEIDNAVGSFNKKQYSVSKPSSLWVVVNKQKSLPSDYTPDSLRQPSVKVRSNGSTEMKLRDDAADALEKLVSGAKKDKLDLMLVSGYRSYGLQKAVYDRNVAEQGTAETDKTSARAGHSEHQTGLGADLGTINGMCELQTCFRETKEGKWLAKNAQNYGFIIRYPEGKQSVVGYSYEPWHIRFVGKGLSREIYKNKTTMEEFFDLPAAPDY